MSLQETKQLVRENDFLQNQVRNFRAVIGVMTLLHGKQKKGYTEYRIAPKDMKKLAHNVEVQSLKSGVIVIKVSEPDDA